MGLFDFFKRTDPIQEYMDGFFKHMAIIDFFAGTDIPIININGNDQRPHADIFFRNTVPSPPNRGNGSDEGLDAIFWIFDSFVVLELGATDEDARQFVVIKLVNLKQGNTEHNALRSRMDAMQSSVRTGVKGTITT